MNLPGISFNDADGKVLLVAQPNPDRPPVDGAVLKALLDQAGFGACLADEAALNSAAKLCNQQQNPFGLEVAVRGAGQGKFGIGGSGTVGSGEFLR